MQGRRCRTCIRVPPSTCKNVGRVLDALWADYRSTSQCAPTYVALLCPSIEHLNTHHSAEHECLQRRIEHRQLQAEANLGDPHKELREGIKERKYVRLHLAEGERVQALCGGAVIFSAGPRPRLRRPSVRQQTQRRGAVGRRELLRVLRRRSAAGVCSRRVGKRLAPRPLLLRVRLLHLFEENESRSVRDDVAQIVLGRTQPAARLHQEAQHGEG